MPTDKPRLQVTLSKDLSGMISFLSKKRKKPRAAIAAELLEMAIELHEDYHLGKLAEKREKENNKWISHEDAWK